MTLSMILTHLALVVAALVFAILAGVPLGILCYFYPSARRVVLRVVDLIQTTPALALLGIIMVFMGAGKPTVIVGLALYSLLPIVRNTHLGLSQVPEYLIEAGRGMGMTRMYRLLHVELPLAAPIIFTGIRIATVNAIGTAVFASFVGGGGLGSFITTGIRQDDMEAILLGTGVLMAMALVLDLLMGLAERYLNSRTGQRSRTSRLIARAASAAACVAAAALCVVAFFPQRTDGLVLYQGEFSEVQLVNSMIQQLVEERHGIPVTIKDQMTAKNNFAELSGAGHSCDLMYTWDGTLLTTIMGLDTSDVPDGQTLYEFVDQRMRPPRPRHQRSHHGFPHPGQDGDGARRCGRGHHRHRPSRRLHRLSGECCGRSPDSGGQDGCAPQPGPQQGYGYLRHPRPGELLGGAFRGAAGCARPHRHPLPVHQHPGVRRDGPAPSALEFQRRGDHRAGKPGDGYQRLPPCVLGQLIEQPKPGKRAARKMMVTDTAVPAAFSFSPHPRNRFSRACPPVQISPPVTKATAGFSTGARAWPSD